MWCFCPISARTTASHVCAIPSTSNSTDELCYTTGNPSDYSKTPRPWNPSCLEERGALPAADIGFSAVSRNWQPHLSNRTSCWWFTWQYSISSRGFMLVNSARVQRPGMCPTQPSSPTQPAQVQAAITPASPPPTTQTVDTSNVPAQQRPVIVTLMQLFNETSEALGGLRANPAKKREIEDNSRKIGALFAKLNSGNISKIASEKLV